MGRDKRRLEYEGKSLLDISVARLKKVAEEVIVVAAAGEALTLGGVISVNDETGERGPLMGIYTGLKRMTSRRGIVNPVDTPDLNEELLRYMKDASDGFDVVMPVLKKGPEPLIAVYSKNVIPVIERILGEGRKPAPHLLLEEGSRLKIRVLGEDELSSLGSTEAMFRNINTPEDLSKLKSQI